jgi:hypothetical protein
VDDGKWCQQKLEFNFIFFTSPHEGERNVRIKNTFFVMWKRWHNIIIDIIDNVMIKKSEMHHAC